VRRLDAHLVAERLGSGPEVAQLPDQRVVLLRGEPRPRGLDVLPLAGDGPALGVVDPLAELMGDVARNTLCDAPCERIVGGQELVLLAGLEGRVEDETGLCQTGDSIGYARRKSRERAG
jgi:hypothetical protein